MEFCENTDPHQQQLTETVTPTEQQPPQTHTPHEHNKPTQMTEEEPEEGDGGLKLSDVREQRACHTHERAIPVQETVETLDITEESETWINMRESADYCKINTRIGTKKYVDENTNTIKLFILLWCFFMLYLEFIVIVWTRAGSFSTSVTRKEMSCFF